MILLGIKLTQAAEEGEKYQNNYYSQKKSEYIVKHYKKVKQSHKDHSAIIISRNIHKIESTGFCFY